MIELQDRDVEGAAAEIVDCDFRFRCELVEAIGERGRGWLVDDSLDGEPGRFAGSLGGVALGVVKIGGHGDDGARDWPLERRLGVALQFSQDESRDFLGCVFPLRGLESEAAGRFA